MDSNFTNENDPWEYTLDIDDYDLHLTHVLHSSSSARVESSSSTPNPVRIIPGPAGTVQLSSSTCFEPSSSTPNPVRIIPGPAGLVQQAKELKEKVFILDSDGALMSIQEYMQKVVMWMRMMILTGKLDQVVAIVKSCSPNYLGDLNVTMKDLSGTVRGTVHYKVLDVGSYGNDITVGAAMILANVSVFTPKTSEYYFNITKKNVIKVFRFVSKYRYVCAFVALVVVAGFGDSGLPEVAMVPLLIATRLHHKKKCVQGQELTEVFKKLDDSVCKYEVFAVDLDGILNKVDESTLRIQ
ncbi:hypothetical protein Tco_1017384 [Tanacetum coccineum]|uniref:Homologous recombination OB-fold protein OB-fold domain-containing protein n=1 Tax=Tanacetum coccineum TaxID=301880 RepID=A0ABQ5FRT2_9ASTR